MKVACIGNMNNNLFSLTRYLRDEGIDAELLLFGDEQSHFHPSADSFTREYESFVQQLTWSALPSGFAGISLKEIENTLNTYDFIIGCGAAPAFLNRIGRPLDMFIPYGSDLYRIPFFQLSGVPWKKIHRYYALARNQRKGIQETRYVSLDATNEDFEEVLTSLHINGSRLKVACPFLYVPQYSDEDFLVHMRRSPHYESFKSIRQKHDLVVFHQSRHEWSSPNNRWTYKRNDKLIRGFAQFVSEAKGSNPCLIMFEYGTDVQASKQLVADLKLESHVRWFPQMPRKDIIVGIHHSDIGAGEFNMSWLSYGVIYEIMAMGKPVMHFRDDSLYSESYPELYPMAHAREAEEIRDVLLDIVKRPAYYRQLGEDGKRWFMKYAIQGPLEAYFKIIRG